MDEAKALGIECKSMDELKKLNKDKKLVKKLGRYTNVCRLWQSQWNTNDEQTGWELKTMTSTLET